MASKLIRTVKESDTSDLGKKIVKYALFIGIPAVVCYLIYKQQQKSKQQGDGDKKRSTITSTTTTTTIRNDEGDTTLASSTKLKDIKLEEAIQLKNEGNTKYHDKKFAEAIEYYTKAIDTCPITYVENLSQFYQNRAAAYESLKDMERVIEDCSRAIELNPKYVKCILRRARAAEAAGNNELALEDYSTVCFLDSYQQVYIMSADKVLTELAKEYIRNLPPNTAELSKDFVRTALNEFEDDPVLSTSFINEMLRTHPDSYLTKAYKAHDDGNFLQIPDLCTREIESEDSQFKIHAHLLRGSFYILIGQYNEAVADFDIVVSNPSSTEEMRINAKLKRANARIHLHDLEGAMNEYNKCIHTHPNSCAPRVHRGMLKTLLEQYDDAHEDFIKAVEISPTNLRAQYQKLINDTKVGSKDNDKSRVERALSQFEEYFDTCKKDIYYSLALTSAYLDNDRTDKALQYLNKFIQEIPDSPTLLALKANCLMATDPSNADEAEKLYKQALDYDVSNETVLTMYAIFKCNRNQFDEAAELYEKAIHCSRGEEKLTQYAALLFAIRAQGRAIKRLNLSFPGNAGFPPGGPASRTGMPAWLGGMG
ncbi:unnamed protein product [Didymodactylos carnosus]|uniref:Mitochondrial import receptor subunit TOM70 n=1 Tax=Didymodactylos carnosus TaxID=1234261 RepID=A0A813PEN4_9BILA|nr:unnamed protein product [Didymodactylos carnosus]CAF0751782.1 unnamed protein product [Didymodactylos carnosus]CAF3509607.1 unnamed protein product [Didymodactylos carnosus]CAF3531481.1 unnamed protein product [Didymodactylos carnosus]